MKSIHYANDTLLTGDDIADALVDLAAELAQRESSVSVEVPVQFGVDDIRNVNFLLGPASQIVAVPAPDSGYDELIRVDVVARLRSLISDDPSRQVVTFEDPNRGFADFDL